MKAYGSPEDIANDSNVDMIVVSVRVGMHYVLTQPALLAGEDLFVEWPLGASSTEARELANIAEAKGVRPVVGLQARASPVVGKLKELIQSRKIGKLLSSTVTSNFADIPADFWPAGAEYFLNMKSGRNVFHIFFAYCLHFQPFCKPC